MKKRLLHWSNGTLRATQKRPDIIICYANFPVFLHNGKLSFSKEYKFIENEEEAYLDVEEISEYFEDRAFLSAKLSDFLIND